MFFGGKGWKVLDILDVLEILDILDFLGILDFLDVLGILCFQGILDNPYPYLSSRMPFRR